MAQRRLIYFTVDHVTAYAWRAGELKVERSFDTGDEAVAEFGVYVSEHPGSLFYLLVDLVEEDFSQETIPAVRGKDRKALIARKIAQRYRDTTLALALSLGIVSAGGRREEKVLFTSFTNTQPFQSWLSVLRSREARLVGVFSIPLLTPLAAKRAGFKNPSFLMVSVAKAGLRQSYVENGQIRFSRLGRADQEDPKVLAEACAAESSRIQQYLVNLRIISRDAGPLDVIVLAPSQHKALYDAACHSTSNLKFHVLDLEATSRACGLKALPDQAGAEALFLHVLAGNQPAGQFAGDDLRRFYHLWRARVALLTVGAAAFAFCLMLSALKLVDVYNVKQRAETDRSLEAVAAQQYARLQVTFPQTPTDTEKLGAIVRNYQTLLSLPNNPEPMLIELSNALAVSPQIEIERIEWETSTSPASAAGAAAKSSALKSPAAIPAARQVAQISGRINHGQSSDYRAITQIVDQFVDALRKQPGIEVVSRRLPFDITAERSLSGDIGVQRAAEVPRFTIVLSKRTAS
jgi:hypothetical protein